MISACQWLAIAAALCPLVSACRPTLRPPVAPTSPLVRLARPPALVDDADVKSLEDALRASLAYYARLPRTRTLAFGTESVPVAGMEAALGSLVALLEGGATREAVASALERDFVAYRARVPSGVLFTGYYVPTLSAQEVPDSRFHVPVLGRPLDLVTVAPVEFGASCTSAVEIVGRVEDGRVRPYPARAAISTGAAAQAPVLAWVEDPVALFFLQIQGSGVLVLPDGSRRMIGFAASNGHPYVSIGKLLIDQGHLRASETSMQGIRRWIDEHPEDRARILDANPRYVFFRPLPDGVVGSLGVPVTAGRTIATDPAVYPPGALAFIRVPAGGGPGPSGAPSLNRLVVNQDAGAAIRSPGRVDVFFGEGSEAEAQAGRMSTRGELYFLAPRTDPGDIAG